MQEHQLSQNIVSQNFLGWKILLRPLSPIIYPALPSPTLSHVPQCHIYTPCRYLQGWSHFHFSGQPVPGLDNAFREEIFANSQSKCPLVHLVAISFYPTTCYLREVTNPYIIATSFQGSTWGITSGKLFIKKQFREKKYSCQHSRETVKVQEGILCRWSPGQKLRSTLSLLALPASFLCYQNLCGSDYSV